MILWDDGQQTTLVSLLDGYVSPLMVSNLHLVDHKGMKGQYKLLRNLSGTIGGAPLNNVSGHTGIISLPLGSLPKRTWRYSSTQLDPLYVPLNISTIHNLKLLAIVPEIEAHSISIIFVLPHTGLSCLFTKYLNNL